MVALEESRFCRRLGSAEWEIARRGAETREFRAGHLIFNEGDAADGLYIVVSGLVEIYIFSSPGRSHTLSLIEPGDYFGDMAIFDGGGRSAAARAVGDSTTAFLPTDVVMRLLDQSPVLAASLVRDASLRIRDFNRRFLTESLKAERAHLFDRLTRAIVHDFRNPLNVIGLAADLAAEPNASPEARKASRFRIRAQVEVMNRMLQEMLDFTRATPTRGALPQFRFDQFLRDLVLEWRGEAARRRVDLEFADPPEVMVRLDPPRFTRVFTNLVNNAFDAMVDKPNPRLSIVATREGDWVSVDFADNGRGVEPEHLGRLFEPFFTYGKTHGTGLGLAICERIALEHGGSITVQSRPGEGATFRVRLPLTRPGDTDRLVNPASETPPV